MISTGKAEGFGNPPAKDIIPGICVTLRSSRISEALKRFARFENNRSILTTVKTPTMGIVHDFIKVSVRENIY